MRDRGVVRKREQDRQPVGKDYDLAHEWEEDGLCEAGYLESLYGLPDYSCAPRPQE